MSAVAGFASESAAKPFRDQIVQVGHQTDEYKKTHKASDAWDDARVMNHLTSGTSATR